VSDRLPHPQPGDEAIARLKAAIDASRRLRKDATRSLRRPSDDDDEDVPSPPPIDLLVDDDGEA
jgi:hypothetical protein